MKSGKIESMIYPAKYNLSPIEAFNLCISWREVIYDPKILSGDASEL
jgi:hypothetical protein